MTRDEAWAELYRGGASVTLIADAAGFSRTRVHQVLAEQGVAGRKPGRVPGRVSWHSEAVVLWAQGLTQYEIAARFGVSQSTVSVAISRFAP